MFQKAAQWMTVMLIRIYQLLISPTIHTIAGPSSGCRFYPNCSTYAIDAIRDHGALRGLWLALRRILRCNPWGGQGFDPVPPKSNWSDVLDNRIRK